MFINNNIHYYYNYYYINNVDDNNNFTEWKLQIAHVMHLFNHSYSLYNITLFIIVLLLVVVVILMFYYYYHYYYYYFSVLFKWIGLETSDRRTQFAVYPHTKIIQRAFSGAAAAAAAAAEDGQQHQLVFNTLSPCPAASGSPIESCRAAPYEYLSPAVSAWRPLVRRARREPGEPGDVMGGHTENWCGLNTQALIVSAPLFPIMSLQMQIPRPAVHSPAPQLHPEMTALWSCHSQTLHLSMAIG